MRHYLILTIAIVFAAGLSLSEAYSYFPVVTSVVIGLIGLFAAGRGRAAHGLYALLLVSVLYGQFHYWHVPSDNIGHLNGQRLAVTLMVAELPETTGSKSRFIAQAVATGSGDQMRPASGRVRVNHYLNKGEPPLTYGDRFTATVTLRPITGLNNPGGFDYAAYMWRQGIHSRISLSRKTEVVREGASSLAGFAFIHDWRSRMKTAIHAALPPEAASLVTALAIGDARGVSQSLRERFQAAGLAHVLAISGTHLGLVAGVVFMLVRGLITVLPYSILVRLTARITPRQIAGVFSLVAVTGYALLSGGHTPTLRALVMVWLVMLALLARRDAHAPTGLGLAAILILLADPGALGTASFQLSFAAVLAILLVLPPLLEKLTEPDQRIRRWAVGSVGVTVAAGLATAPLVAFHFGQVAWPGFFANLVLLPILGFVLLPVFLVSAVLSPAFGTLPFSEWVETLSAGFISGADFFATWPAALTHVPSPPLMLVAGTYAVAVLLLLGRGRADTRAALTGAIILPVVWLLALHPTPATGELKVTFLDVAQGDSTIITGPDGATLVIDGGTRVGRFDLGRLAVAPYLWQQGIDRPALLATHPQIDHQGGLSYVAERFATAGVYTNGVRRRGTRFDDVFHATLKAQQSHAQTVHKGSDFAPLPGVATVVLHPAQNSLESLSENDRSVVLRLQYGNHSFLFAGDIEQAAEDELVRTGETLAATVLKVPHHGSSSSSTDAFLTRVAPRLAVISAGPGNPYRHPHKKVQDAYKKHGIPTHVTASDGAVMMTSNGIHLKVVTARELRMARLAPWAGLPLAGEYRNGVRLLAPGSLWRQAPL